MLVSHAINLVFLKQVGSFIIGLLYVYFFLLLAVNSFCCATFGQGYGPIWFDNVGCTSSNTNLFDCNKNSIGSHNCGHNEDAGARCYGNECMRID